MAERSVLIKLGSKVGPGGERGFKKMRKGIGGLGALAAKALNFGKLVAVGGAAVATAFLVKGTNDARSFGKAMTEVRTIINDSETDINALSKEVLALSKATGKGPEDLAKSLFQAISAGIDAGEAMKFLEASTKLAVGGFAEVTEVVDLGTNVLNAYGLSASEMGRVSDIAFKAVEKGKTTISELAKSMGTVLPFAAQLEVSLEDLFAATATLTKGGIDTTNAVTFLKGALTAILKPSKEASKAAERLKIDFTASALKAKGLSKFLEEVKIATGGSSVELAKLFGNVRGLTAVLGLAGKQSEEFARIQKALADSAGATDLAFKKASESVGIQFDKALNELKVIGIEVGEEILPSVVRVLTVMLPLIEKAARFTAELAEGFASLIEGGQGFRNVVSTLLKFTGPAGFIASQFIDTGATEAEKERALERVRGGRFEEFRLRAERGENIDTGAQTFLDSQMRQRGKEIADKVVQGLTGAVDNLQSGLEVRLREQNTRQITLAPG